MEQEQQTLKFIQNIKRKDNGSTNKKQKETLKAHSVHHTKRHMNYMVRKMREGMSFARAHRMAQEKIGK